MCVRSEIHPVYQCSSEMCQARDDHVHVNIILLRLNGILKHVGKKKDGERKGGKYNRGMIEITRK